MNLVKKISIIICFILVYLPILQLNFDFINYTMLDEKRDKIKKPEGAFIVELYKFGSLWSQNYEKYFNDNFGFRDLLIKSKNQIDYSIFGISDLILIGKEGFLFYKSVVEKEQINTERLNSTQIINIENKFLLLNNMLKAKGITLIVMPIELKNVVYYDKLPNNNVSRPSNNVFNILRNFLNEENIPIIDSTKILLEKRKEFPVYYKTDFHWNDLGAHFVSQELIFKIAQLSSIDFDLQNRFEFENSLFIGPQSKDSLAIFQDLAEYAPKVKASNNAQYYKQKLPFQLQYINPHVSKKLLPKTIIIGNSFTGTLEHINFYEYFSEITWLHSNNFKLLSIEDIPSDTKFVVFQYIDVDIGNNMCHDSWWPNTNNKI